MVLIDAQQGNLLNDPELYIENYLKSQLYHSKTEKMWLNL